jgi:hypothetical protein
MRLGTRGNGDKPLKSAKVFKNYRRIRIEKELNQ